MGPRTGQQHRADCEDHFRSASSEGGGGTDCHRCRPGGLDDGLGLWFVDRPACMGVWQQSMWATKTVSACVRTIGQSTVRSDSGRFSDSMASGSIPDQRALLELVDRYFRGPDGPCHAKAEQQPVPIALVAGFRDHADEPDVVRIDVESGFFLDLPSCTFVGAFPDAHFEFAADGRVHARVGVLATGAASAAGPPYPRDSTAPRSGRATAGSMRH